MDPAPIPQGADPVPGATCVDTKRLRCSATLTDPMSKFIDDDNTSSWLVPAAPLDDENLLPEILLRLPPQPCSLPRASLVCKQWRSILSDPQFLGRFRKHHRRPPLLGFFVGKALRGKPVFTSVLEPPDRIPSTRFSVPENRSPNERCFFSGSRHGLAVLVRQPRSEIVVWDPLTSQQHCVSFPAGLDYKRVGYCQAAVLCADSEDEHVHGDCFLSPFKLVFICIRHMEAFVSLYDSTSGVWGNIVSKATNTVLMARPSILVGNTLFWSTLREDILAFDFEMQSLSVLEMPEDNHVTDDWYFQLLRMQDGGLGLVVLSELTIQLWERKSNFDGVVGWVRQQKTVQLEELFPHIIHRDCKIVLILGYDEETNVIVLSTMIGYFMLQLDTMQIRHIIKRDDICYDTLFPYTNFYTAGRRVEWKFLDPKL